MDNLKNKIFSICFFWILIIVQVNITSCVPTSKSQDKGIIMDTEDGGATWFDPCIVKGSSEIMDACMIGTENTIIAVGSDSYQNGAIFRTIDFGDSWETVTTSMNTKRFLAIGSTYPGDLGGNAIVVGDTLRFYRTVDYFSNMIISNSPTTNTIVGIDFFHFIQNVGFAVGVNGTVLRTTDVGDSWTVNNLGDYTFSDVSTVGYYSDSAIVVITCSYPRNTIMRSEDVGLTWSEITISSSVENVFNAVYFPPETRHDGVENMGLMVGYPGIIYKSIDKGLTWVQKLNSDEYIHFNDVVIGLEGNCIAVGNYYIYHSSDYGETWTKVYENYDYLLKSVYHRDENSLYGFAAGFKHEH